MGLAQDLGVQLSLNGAGTGTYKDAGGVSHNNGTLGAAYVAGTTFQMGRGQAAALSVKCGQGHTASITVKLESRRIDVNNPAIFSWAPVQCVRSDKGTQAVEHVILAADTTAFADIRLLTPDESCGGDFRISAKASGAADATDSIVVGVDVAR
jgi:hypothetical protein